MANSTAADLSQTMRKIQLQRLPCGSACSWRIVEASSPERAARKAEREIAEPNWIRVIDEGEKEHEFPGGPSPLD